MKLSEYRKDPELLREAMLELARQDLWTFCHVMYPKFFVKSRKYLQEMCDQIQAFVEQDERHFLLIKAPPRHGKSLTAQSLTAWLFGENPQYKVMTGSYNERLSGIFARTVRNMIQTEQIGDNIVYSDVFPETKVKYGEASASMWSLEGSNQVNYLATSPNATATGFGCDFLIVDDIIKSAEEAYNDITLDNHWSWFVNTMLSRLEGKRKVIIIMTRWAEGDLAGRIKSAYGDDVQEITYKAVQDDGTMLCDEILGKKDYESLIKEMNLDIVEANYNQKPIDVGGRLYGEFKEWQVQPEFREVLNQTDSADTGTDFLCSINYGVYDNEVYITDLVFTDEPMEVTEPATADLLDRGGVNVSNIESNNGGRGFARNVESLLKSRNNRTQINSVAQTKNKESRILASSAWVQNHVYMPFGWKQRWPEFYKQVMSYQRKGRNAHDDAVDVLASIYESMGNDRVARVTTNDDLRRPRRATFMR